MGEPFKNANDYNGLYVKLIALQSSVDQMKDEQDSISGVLSGLTSAINNLALIVTNLGNKIDSVRDAIPIKVVAWMFVILVLTIAGIQGLDWLFKVYLKGGV